jgi:hypothetical protein
MGSALSLNAIIVASDGGALPVRWTPLSLTPGKYSIQIQLGNQTYSSSFIQH